MALEAPELGWFRVPSRGPFCPRQLVGHREGHVQVLSERVPWVPPMPSAWFSLFPAPLLCGTLQWGPKGGFCSLMDGWSTSHCGPQVLPRPGSGCAVEVAPVWV